MKSQYKGIDLFKIIAAYLIILLHLPVFREGLGNDIVRQVVTVVAVPFFFTASGFLLSNKLSAMDRKLPMCVKINYKKYIIWSLIYFPIVCFGWLVNSKTIGYDLLYYVRDFVLEGSYLTIWFLNALSIALLIEWLLLKKFSKKDCFLISVPFWVIACLLSSYNQLFVENLGGKDITNIYYSIFSTTKNGLLFGFPFISLGVWLADKKEKNKKSQFLSLVCVFLLYF